MDGVSPSELERVLNDNRRLERQQRKMERDLNKLAETAGLYEEECVKRQRLNKQILLQNVQVNGLSEQLKSREHYLKLAEKERASLREQVAALDTDITDIRRLA